MKNAIKNLLQSIPPFVIFLGSVLAVGSWGAFKLLAMLRDAGMGA